MAESQRTTEDNSFAQEHADTDKTIQSHGNDKGDTSWAFDLLSGLDGKKVDPREDTPITNA